MSECTPAWFAVPLRHLTTESRQQVVADILGMRRAELLALLDHQPASLTSLVLNDIADETCLATVDGTPCLTWTQSWASNGGEWDAQQLQDHQIPFLRWWGSCSAFEAGAAVFGGRAEPRIIRCDTQLQPVIGAQIKGRIRLDKDELQDLRQYCLTRNAVLSFRPSKKA